MRLLPVWSLKRNKNKLRNIFNTQPEIMFFINEKLAKKLHAFIGAFDSITQLNIIKKIS